MRPRDQLRNVYAERYGLTTERQRKRLSARFLQQLKRCKDEDARRLLLGVSKRDEAVTGLRQRVEFRSQSTEWATPKAVYQMLDAEFHFDFDPCPINGKVDGTRALLNLWDGRRVFCNPPYDRRSITRFLKLWPHAEIAVYLLPVKTDSHWFHEICLPHAREIRFIKGRLTFGDAKHNAPFPSMVVVMGKTKTALEK